MIKSFSDSCLITSLPIGDRKKKIVSEISGHTDNVGSDEVNDKLSQARADVVRNYLLTQGVPAERITAKGYGKNKPKEIGRAHV